MRVDPEVASRKFDREVRRLFDNKAALDERGIFVVGRPSYPVVDVLYVPRHSLLVLGGTPAPGVQLGAHEVTVLAGRAFKASFDLTDYDLDPPSVDFRDPWTNELLSYGSMFRAQEFEDTRGPHVVLLDGHPITKRPFLCLRGVREYHNHPQHSGDDWMLYRTGMSLFDLVMRVWRVGVDVIRPMIVPVPNGLQVQWLNANKH